MNKEFITALNDLEKSKNIPKEQILDALEKAIIGVYRSKVKNPDANVIVDIDPNTGVIEVNLRKTVVDEVMDPVTEVSLEEVREFDPDYEEGDMVDYEQQIDDLGRIAAQTVKQVVFQNVREIERGLIYDEFIDKEMELISGVIQRVSHETVFVNLGRTEGIMAAAEQVKGERYTMNARMKFFIVDVRRSMKGPQVFLSRSHPALVRRLFELEVSEIQEGIVTIESIAREAGSRTKMAVSSSDESVDPVGACVGARGARVQAVVDELFGEKIDIIPWGEDAEENVSSALAPAKVEKVVYNEEENIATVVVPDYQLSLAIGKEGQNVRLAAKLAGMKIDIKSHTQYFGGASDDLAGMLDDEGYLNPDDFMTNSEIAEAAAAAETTAEEPEEAEAAEGEETAETEVVEAAEPEEPEEPEGEVAEEVADEEEAEKGEEQD
ncbi:MAG: transcription termination factor NusA [Clostridiales Family XIII bacterium]|jgi:N utilization substance protein A|nr:transcription termination factor NusA [Clostridiales Family XIII bacterium]